MLLKAPISGVLIAGVLMAGNAVPAQGENCGRTVHKAEDNLRKEVLKHGEFSPQARYRRHQLDEARWRCGQGASFRDHDRDRDRDHDHDRHHRRRHDHDRDGDHDRR